MQRDLNMDEPTARRRVADEARAAAVEAEIVPALGQAYAGSWFDPASGRLTIGITDPDLARQVAAAGANPKPMSYSYGRLDSIKRELDDLAAKDPAAADGVAAWRVDPIRNRVVVTLLTGRPRSALAAAAGRHGNAVAFESTTHEAVSTADYVDGGEKITSAGKACSIGFNARLTYSDLPGVSDPVVITAGHCADTTSYDVYAYGQSPSVGIRLGRWWLRDFGRDWAVVGVTDRENWIQGPWVALHTANDDYATMFGTQQQPIGGTVCKSGITTKVTCGVIRARNETVRQSDTGRSVTGLTRHTACAEPGDSGGSNYTPASQAQGVTSTSTVMTDTSGRNRCLSVFGQENRGWYVEITYIQGYTGARILTG
ncbi:S1 family peptidase [Streptomyces sp. NPDC127106]|uniref:S1 family peptidase n=1 Tax=Streptomyces sp. NPDC127106 TaxID=3345360 RepID=UPI003643591A